jgi:hypothetical protein
MSANTVSGGRVRDAIVAVLPERWTLVNAGARQVGSAGRAVATVRWSGGHEMTVDIGSTTGMEDAIAELIDAFERLSYVALRAGK